MRGLPAFTTRSGSRPCSFRSHHAAFVVTRRLAGVLRLFHLAHHKLKGLGDVIIQPGAGLGESALEFFRQRSSLVGGDLSLLGLQVALVADNDQRNPVGTLYLPSVGRAGNSARRACTYEVVQNLFPDHSNHVEGLLRGDRVHQHVSMNADEVFRVQDAVFVLSTPARGPLPVSVTVSA